MSDTQHDEKQEITIVDIKMPFMSMVIFLVKLAIASIPAFIILSFFLCYSVCYLVASSMVSVREWDVINFDQHY